MNPLERLKELEAMIDETKSDEIVCHQGWPEYIDEVERILPKLLAAVDMAKRYRKCYCQDNERRVGRKLDELLTELEREV